MRALLALVLLAGCSVSTAAPNCMSPSLPNGAFHVVIAGWQRRAPWCFQHYLHEMGLTNAHAFIYRRVDPLAPVFAPVRGPCGLLVEERLLLPNHGREASAFYDWIVEHYDSMPQAVVFMHGHGPHAWHTTCQAVVSRSRLAYEHYTNADTAAQIAKHVVTLTRLDPKTNKDEQIPLKPHDQRHDLDMHRGGNAWSMCEAILGKVNMTIPTHKFSCCSMFIAPGKSITRLPKWFWEEMRAYSLRFDVSDWSSARVCFECARPRRVPRPRPRSARCPQQPTPGARLVRSRRRRAAAAAASA